MIKFLLLEGVLELGHPFKELLSYDGIALAWHMRKKGGSDSSRYLDELILLLINSA
jgi:hypothetical protein